MTHSALGTQFLGYIHRRQLACDLNQLLIFESPLQHPQQMAAPPFYLGYPSNKKIRLPKVSPLLSSRNQTHRSKY